MERRSLKISEQFNTRQEENGNLYIEGYFAVFNKYYEMWEGAFETIAPTAFDKTINDDVRALINHESTLVLGRSGANTLKLKVDEHGLWGSILINKSDTDAMNLYERVKRGDVNQCSFGFDILSEEYTQRDDGTVLWTVNEVKLYEVSVVTFPAYEDTEVQARQKDFEKIRKKQNQVWREKMHNKLKGV